MDELFGGWRFALRRFCANWPLMALVGAGALLATTLLAAAPIYADAMAELGLRFRLERELDDPRLRVPHLSAERLRLGDPVQLAQARGMDAITRARLGWLAPELLGELRSEPLGLRFADAPAAPAPGEPARRPWQARLVHLAGYEDHVRVVEGRLPAPGAEIAEAALPDGFQREAAVGDRLLLTAPRYDDCRRVPPSEDEEVAADEVPCRPSAFVRATLEARVVGFVRPADPADPRWRLFRDGWSVPDRPPRTGFPPNEGEGWMPLLTSGAYYRGALTRQLPELVSRYRVGVAPGSRALAVRDVPRALADFAAWPEDVREGLGLPVGRRLEFADALAAFHNASTFAQAPLLLLLLQVAGVAAFYIVVLTALAREREAQEIAVYRSRGASTPQLLGLTLAAGLLLAVPAALLGPPLAERAVAALGWTPAFRGITGGAALPAAAGEDAFLLAAAGAALALAAMLLPALGIVRRAIVDAKREQARPQRRGWVQRYYLDLGLALLAALLVWQLGRRGAVFDPQSVGGWDADPLLLLSPLAITAAAAALVLRVYPPLLRLLALLLRPLRGTAVTLGLGRAGRDPAASARLLLLVSMAVAVGVFAASYAPTVDRSYEDRARYAHGPDLRAGIVGFALPESRDRLGALRAEDGVAGALLAHRGSVGAPVGGGLELLALGDRERAAAMLPWRGDFADEPPGALLERLDLGAPPGGGLALPGDTTAIALSAYTLIPPRIGRLRASIRDGHGAYHDAVFGPLAAGEWTELRAALPAGLAPPLSLAGLRFTDRRVFVSNDGALFLDDLTALRADGGRAPVEDFEGLFAWTMYSQPGSSETFGPSEERARSGRRAARWTWTRETGERSRVLAPADPAVPLNAILSERALAAIGARPGDRVPALLGDGYVVPLLVRGAAGFFPTLDPAGFAIVDLAQLRSIAGALGSPALRTPNELWIDFGEDMPLGAQRAFAERLADRERTPFPAAQPLLLADRLDEIAADPTLRAAGGGILLLAFAGAMGAAVLGFAVSLAITLRGRALEVAVLRALGASRRGVLRAFALEWSVALVFGAAIGVLLGLRISRLMLRFLEVTEHGDPVTPPFSVATAWELIGAGVGVLAATAALALWAAWRAVLRRADAAALRLTQ